MNSVLIHVIIVLLQHFLNTKLVLTSVMSFKNWLIDRIVVRKIVNSKLISKNATPIKLTLCYIINILDKQVYWQEISIQWTVHSGEDAAYRVRQLSHSKSLQSQFDVAVFFSKVRKYFNNYYLCLLHCDRKKAHKISYHFSSFYAHFLRCMDLLYISVKL